MATSWHNSIPSFLVVASRRTFRYNSILLARSTVMTFFAPPYLQPTRLRSEVSSHLATYTHCNRQLPHLGNLPYVRSLERSM